MNPAPLAQSVLIVIPAYGSAALTDAVLGDLVRDDRDLLPHSRIVVVDNRGDYEPAVTDDRVSVYRSGENLRWIGSTNWALADAAERGEDVCLVLNNDTRLSADLPYWVSLGLAECDGAAVAAPCYDDFWLHQRLRPPVDDPADFAPARAYRDVPFCDGTGLAFSIAAYRELGPLDTVAFPRHGYGADIDYSLRARDAGMRAVITESAYLTHLRRGTMNGLPEETRERARLEIVDGMDAKWGADWRARAGLSEHAFPPHNFGSAGSWYRSG
ncbi:glycosyltransferase [Nakamurella flavida]|uniref:Glycosyltransferase n=1 Tax=Nakamurella flavida TaxID=363630 RepID=A0A939C4X8_9ACTN|nr:glycosyltransferase [Nakamurella flavida]MBM9476204.1 glycosyltransferase [Nakamurella flavida]MDP9779698.1 GT2 family glycosyltransferase [Nakamurella flavida]